MAVVQVKMLPGGWSRRTDERLEKYFERRLLVICDDPLDGPEIAGNAAGVPVIGEAYAIGNDSASAYCREVRVQSRGGDHEATRQFYVTAQYSTTFDPAQNNPNPLLRPGIPSWGGNKYELVAEKQIDGKPIANSLGYPFDDPVMRRFSTSVLTYKRNEASFPLSLAMSYRDTINSDAFLGADPYQVFCQDITAEYVFGGGMNYYEVTYVFEFRKEGWREQIKNTSWWYREKTTDPVGAKNHKPWGGERPVTIVNSTTGSQNGVIKPWADPLEDKHFVTLKIQDEVAFNVFNIVLP